MIEFRSDHPVNGTNPPVFHFTPNLFVDCRHDDMVLMVVMKDCTNVRSTLLTALLFATLLGLRPTPTAFAGDADKCASMIQLAYGKYYSCTLKAHSKATKKGETPVDVYALSLIHI